MKAEDVTISAIEDGRLRTCAAATDVASAPDEAAPFATAAIVHDDETVILVLRPSPWFIALAPAGSLAFIAILTLALMWLARLSPMQWSDRQALALGAALAGVRLAWQAMEWWTRLYVLTDRRMIRRSGVLRMAIEERLLKRIRHAGVVAGRRERLVGLGTIALAATDSGAFEPFWIMISHPLEVHRVVREAIKRYGRRQ